MFVEMFFGDVLERYEFVNAGVVNQNVELAERRLRLGEKALAVFFVRDISLPRFAISSTTRSAPSFEEA